MKIYTKTGDTGTTALFGGRRVSKTDAHVEAYGTIDELSAHLAVLRCCAISENHKSYVQKIQNTLFVIGSILADGEKKRSAYIPTFDVENTTDLENIIDALEKDLTPLKNFILAGSSAPLIVTHWDVTSNALTKNSSHDWMGVLYSSITPSAQFC